MVFRRKGTGRKFGPAKKDDNSALKIKLRGKDNTPLTMQQLFEGLLEAARLLKGYETAYRAKSATIYLTMIDEDGTAVRINDANELVIFPYKSAAEEHGV
ncbi:MAG: hypothetical protein ACREDT_01545 [Methylocella sp.]